MGAMSPNNNKKQAGKNFRFDPQKPRSFAAAIAVHPGWRGDIHRGGDKSHGGDIPQGGDTSVGGGDVFPL